MLMVCVYIPSLFQSTLPMRGATMEKLNTKRDRQNFNPHSPCGERPSSFHPAFLICLISIHTPHAGSDVNTVENYKKRLISIHTPHAGSDVVLPVLLGCDTDNFNPHSPCGERHVRRLQYRIQSNNFNPHSPCGERRRRRCYTVRISQISIHTPHAGSDSARVLYLCFFNTASNSF